MFRKKDLQNPTLEEIRIRDAAKDSSTVIWGVIILCSVFMAGLFIGDFFYGKTYMTPEITHSFLSFLLGSCLTAIVTSFFQSRAMEKMRQNLQQEQQERGDTQ